MHLLKLSALSSLLLLGACSSNSSLRGDYADLSPEMVTPLNINTSRVVWAGQVKNIVNHEGSTCFVAVSYKKDPANRPMMNSSGDGPRFIACKKYEYPNKDLVNRLVTVSGPIISLSSDEKGLVYYPIVKIDDLKLWNTPDGSAMNLPVGFNSPGVNVR
ncbi:Slp family lipoprotein [Marinicella sp. W31]|uniref:Slp family lipoprotein n=1 Tax=Marinicella sp. W31 TaxID=3023713 RepID=UPI0037566543